MSRIKASKALSDEGKTDLREYVRKKSEAILEQCSDLKNAEVEYIKSRYNKCWATLIILSDKYDVFYHSTSELDMKRIPAILDFAGYAYSRETMSCIFGMDSKKGFRSIRYMIEKSNKASFDEIHERFKELNDYMDVFLNMINNCDG